MKRGANVHGKKFLLSAGIGFSLVVALILGGLLSGVAIAMPISGVGGFVIEADKILVKNFQLNASANDTSAREHDDPGEGFTGAGGTNQPVHGGEGGVDGFSYPQGYIALDATIYGLKLWKQLKLNTTTCLEARITTPPTTAVIGGDGGYERNCGLDEGTGPPAMTAINGVVNGTTGNELQIYATRVYADATFSGLLIDEVYTNTIHNKFVLKAVYGKLEKAKINAHQLFAPSIVLGGLRVGVATYTLRTLGAAELSPNGNLDWNVGGSYANI